MRKICLEERGWGMIYTREITLYNSTTFFLRYMHFRTSWKFKQNQIENPPLIKAENICLLNNVIGRDASESESRTLQCTHLIRSTVNTISGSLDHPANRIPNFKSKSSKLFQTFIRDIQSYRYIVYIGRIRLRACVQQFLFYLSDQRLYLVYM